MHARLREILSGCFPIGYYCYTLFVLSVTLSRLFQGSPPIPPKATQLHLLLTGRSYAQQDFNDIFPEQATSFVPVGYVEYGYKLLKQ